jgi:hypothetical protein
MRGYLLHTASQKIRIRLITNQNGTKDVWRAGREGEPKGGGRRTNQEGAENKRGHSN